MKTADYRDYREYIHMQRPVSRRTPMAPERRAKQFAPFAALRGFDETIRKEEVMHGESAD